MAPEFTTHNERRTNLKMTSCVCSAERAIWWPRTRQLRANKAERAEGRMSTFRNSFESEMTIDSNANERAREIFRQKSICFVCRCCGRRLSQPECTQLRARPVSGGRRRREARIDCGRSQASQRQHYLLLRIDSALGSIIISVRKPYDHSIYRFRFMSIKNEIKAG